MECLAALRSACNSHLTENECSATDPVVFAAQYTVSCAWAEVVALADVPSCEVVSRHGRCEARLELDMCGDSCAGEIMYGDIHVMPAARELIRMCNGPLGAWSAVGSESDEIAECLPGTELAICACLDAVCE